MNNYTQQETEQFLFERNTKREQERFAKKHPQVVHIAQSMIDMKDKNGKLTGVKVKAFKTGKTFRGSVRTQFTGPKRNNFGKVYSLA